MSEKTMRQRVVKALKPLDAISVENAVGAGTPDVNYVEGWIELKQMEQWPSRGGPLRVPHFKPHQRVWLRRRWKKGGAAYMLLQVKAEWFLLAGDTAAACLGEATAATLQNLSLHYWPNGLIAEELVKCLGERIGCPS